MNESVYQRNVPTLTLGHGLVQCKHCFAEAAPLAPAGLVSGQRRMRARSPLKRHLRTAYP